MFHLCGEGTDALKGLGTRLRRPIATVCRALVEHPVGWAAVIVLACIGGLTITTTGDPSLVDWRGSLLACVATCFAVVVFWCSGMSKGNLLQRAAAVGVTVFSVLAAGYSFWEGSEQRDALPALALAGALYVMVIAGVLWVVGKVGLAITVRGESSPTA